MKIKVIKKNEVNVAKPALATQENLKNGTVRELVSTVSNWVSEFQLRRNEETRQAFEQLFAQHQQPGYCQNK